MALGRVVNGEEVAFDNPRVVVNGERRHARRQGGLVYHGHEV
jgi:hypothetical protein